jgi:hypothetical protein
VVYGETNKETKGKLHYCETASLLKVNSLLYQATAFGKTNGLLGSLLLNHYATKTNFRTSDSVINRLLRQLCNRFNPKSREVMETHLRIVLPQRLAVKTSYYFRPVCVPVYLQDGKC